MVFDKNWRPDNWEQLKKNVLEGTPIIFSPSAGYSRDQKDTIMEKAASAVLGALAEVLVIDINA